MSGTSSAVFGLRWVRWVTSLGGGLLVLYACGGDVADENALVTPASNSGGAVPDGITTGGSGTESNLGAAGRVDPSGASGSASKDLGTGGNNSGTGGLGGTSSGTQAQAGTNHSGTDGDAATTGSTIDAGAEASGPGVRRPCPAYTGGAWIDDMEDGSSRVCDGDGRIGVWYAYHDEAPRATQWPALTTPGVPIESSPIPGGRGSSTRAMHTVGSGFDDWGAGIGLDFAFDGTSYGLYDATAFDGVTFWTRGVTPRMQVRIGTERTTLREWGGACEKEPCDPDNVWFAPTEEWSQVWVPFDALAPDFERNKLTNLQFFYGDDGGAFDFWIDDVAFYTGEPGCCSPPPDGCEGTVRLGDEQLQRRIGSTPPTCKDLCFRAVFDCGGLTSLDGLQCFTGLVDLSSYGSVTDDLTPLHNLSRLTTLRATNGRLGGLEALSRLTALRTLDLSYNRITSALPLQRLVRLVQLKLYDNQLTSTEGLSDLTGLTELNLANNQITDVRPLSPLTHLIKLDLSYNPLSDVAPLAKLSGLQMLVLRNDQLEDLGPLTQFDWQPLENGKLPALDISNNPFSCDGQAANLQALRTRVQLATTCP